MTSAAHPERYKNHRFPPEIISHGIVNLMADTRFPEIFLDIPNAIVAQDELEFDTHGGAPPG